MRAMPTPMGTGFFVSADGWFLTAAHVVMDPMTKAARADIDAAWLTKEGRAPEVFGAMCQYAEIVECMPEIDIALLKVDWEKNCNKASLKGRSGFPYIRPSVRELEDAEPVYSFGYPLSEASIEYHDAQVTIGGQALCPRVTSAIIASHLDQSEMFVPGVRPRVYVLDKALNYGNSGGPILSVETGHVHALCSRS